MKLKEIGEFGFIERFKPAFDHLIAKGTTGIGDDCSIMPTGEGRNLLVTTDLLIEGVHFLREAITPYQLGIKSLAVSLSDIAAMGGKPVGSFLSVAIPSDVDVEYLDSFMEGYHQLSNLHKTPLLGGDTTKSLQHLAINVCAIGECPKGRAKLRSSAKPGDLICVTGSLGSSAAGLQALLQGIKKDDDVRSLIEGHHQPDVRVNEGLLLAGTAGVNAMMDISDGIASDLLHILKASGCGATVDIDKLPISETMSKVAISCGWNKYQLAATGGEDYELLLTISPEYYNEVSTAFSAAFNIPLTAIGKIVAGAPTISWRFNGRPTNESLHGFNHFT